MYCTYIVITIHFVWFLLFSTYHIVQNIKELMSGYTSFVKIKLFLLTYTGRFVVELFQLKHQRNSNSEINIHSCITSNSFLKPNY